MKKHDMQARKCVMIGEGKDMSRCVILKKSCPELVSGLFQDLAHDEISRKISNARLLLRRWLDFTPGKMLKQVQHDIPPHVIACNEKGIMSLRSGTVGCRQQSNICAISPCGVVSFDAGRSRIKCAMTCEGKYMRVRKAAFTLAETLIALAVIGIVAALTIPQLTSKYRGTIAVNRLKKAMFTVGQAHNMGIADGLPSSSERPGFEPFNPDEALKMFETYYVPYIKFDKVEKGEKGVFGYMQDGTALYFIKSQFPDKGWGCTYIIVCITHKACQNIEESSLDTSLKNLVNGKDTFGIYTSGVVPTWSQEHCTREQLLTNCKNGTDVEACTILLFDAGWKIPEDYPIKF